MSKKNRDFSQLPYSVRLQIRKQAEIQAEREATAMRMIKSMLEAMHSVEGYGFKRLIRFSQDFKNKIQEFYEDREHMESQVYRRLATHGVECENTFDCIYYGRTKAEHIAAEGVDAAKVALAIGLITANDVAGFGSDRLASLIEKTQEIFVNRCESATNEKSHDEALEKIGFCIENGCVLIYQNEDGRYIEKRRAENGISQIQSN